MKTLTDEELNIELCKWLGWEKAQRSRDGNDLLWKHPNNSGLWDQLNLPNHITGIEALGNVHEVESKLEWKQLLEYDRQLEQVCWYRDGEVDDGRISLIRATARQRVTAILLVVRPEIFK